MSTRTKVHDHAVAQLRGKIIPYLRIRGEMMQISPVLVELQHNNNKQENGDTTAHAGKSPMA